MKNDSPYHSLTSWDSHTPRILMIAVIVLAAAAAIYYFSLPGHGERTGTPPDLVFAVRQHFRENEKRAVESMRSFRCDSFTDGEKVIDAPDNTLDVVLENRKARFEEDQRTSRWVVLATYKGDRQWDLASFVRAPDSGDDPCVR